MKRQIVVQFLRPEWRRLLLFALLTAVAVGGKIQAWAFADWGPKPLLYDLLQPFPIWSLWLFLLMPLAVLSVPLRWIGIDMLGGPAWLFIAANLLYFYVLSCLTIVGIDWVKAKWKSQSIRGRKS
jgi:hypothetical protein